MQINIIKFFLIFSFFANLSLLVAQQSRPTFPNFKGEERVENQHFSTSSIDSFNTIFNKNDFFLHKENYLTDVSAVVDSVVIINSETNDVKYIEEYNSENHLISRIIQEKKNSQWQNIDNIRIEYNSNGYNTKYESLYWTNGSWKNDYRTTYDHDSFGNTIFTLAESYYNDKWENIRKTEKKFNSYGSLVYLREYVWKEEWEIKSYELYEYSLENQIISEELMYNPDDVSRTEYEYDEEGRLIIETSLKILEPSEFSDIDEPRPPQSHLINLEQLINVILVDMKKLQQVIIGKIMNGLKAIDP